MIERIDYTKALEIRLRWLQWSKTDATKIYYDEPACSSLPLYQKSLETGETFFMNKRFCELVDVARRTIPDDLEFDPTWLVTPNGWMWIDEPFCCPKFVTLEDGNPNVEETMFGGHPFRLSAVSWFQVPLGSGATEVLFYMDRGLINPKPLSGFGMWAYFTICSGEKVLDRLRKFEQHVNDGIGNMEQDGRYVDGPSMDMLHEIRWFYTAMHLMSQKLSTTVQHVAERGTRRRWEREKVTLQPFLRIVTLRRMEEDRKKDPIGHGVDWHWQWKVDGHWRAQWFPSEQVHKKIWIESYVKGPEDKPFKPVPLTIFKAAR
jgi:hypothetical protein